MSQLFLISHQHGVYICMSFSERVIKRVQSGHDKLFDTENLTDVVGGPQGKNI